MRSVFVALGLCALASFTTARAEQAAPNPILDNYRAYRAALEAGDLATAETAASAALDASQARDGQGGRTGILALNLAEVRLLRGEGVAAGPPARLALQIVQAQGATSGVDPLIAHLVEGQTELASDAPSGRDTLVAALAEADQRTGIDDDAYPAALSLAHWAIEHHQFDIARNAWNSAGRHAGGAMIDPDLARANAQIGVAATFIVEGGDANLNSAEPILSDVMQRIGPAAGQDSPDHAITEAQRTYAQATAWWGTREALLGTRARAANSSNPQNRPADISHSEFCTVTWEGVQHTVSSRYYPQRALEHGQQGVVVVRVIFADNGTVVRGDVVAAAPDQVFNQSAISVATTGRIRRADGQPSTCVLPHVLFKVINFVGAASGHGGQTW